MTQYRILIVEDDATIASLLTENLSRWGFIPCAVTDFSDVVGEFNAFSPQLVLMDISLPFYNGYYWCSCIRASSHVPILFLSSHVENMDIVMAMNMGGDDYITKPFSLEVLVAKLNALLRRAYGSFSEKDRALLICGGAVLDTSCGTVSSDAGSVELTRNELKILSALMQHPGCVVSRESLMQRLWDSECFIDDNTLTVNVNRLRKKLDSIDLADLIVTRKGEGYLVHE